MKKLISVMLCLMMVLSAFALAACGGSDDGSDKTTDNDADENFPNEHIDWGGETINILGYTGEFHYHSCQVDIEEASDEPVENAFYNRNALIEEKYGLNIDVTIPGTGEDYVTMLRNDMLTSTDGGKYQAIVCPILRAAPLAVEGLFHDFSELNGKYLHMNEAWWDQSLIEDVKINNKIYFLTGDALVEDDEATWAMFFNKDIVEEYGLESPYDLVNNNEWTLDKMYELAQKVELTNGDTKSYDPAVGDVWGLLVQSFDFYMFMQGCEQPMIDNTGDVPVLRVDHEENVATFMDIAEFYYDPVNVGVADYHGSWKDGIYDTEKEIFANGNGLFMTGGISYISTGAMKETEINYGIVPMPKRSELQENYSTGVTIYHFATMSIPFTNKGEKLDATCYALEAMAYYGQKMVTPEYYDRTVTLKRFEDEESKEMLDLIFDNRTYDLGAIFDFSNGSGVGTLGFYTALLGSRSNDVVSEYERYKNSFQAGINDLIEQCEAAQNKK